MSAKRRGKEKEKKVKATSMSKNEMVEMVKILEKHDYDGKLAHYERPNTRKDHILDKVVEVLRCKHGVERSKDQLRKRWSDLKHREQNQLQEIHERIKKCKNICFLT